MKKPKKPTLKKLPKQPKQTAPLKTWENYYARCEAVRKENQERLKQYNKAVKKIEADEKKKRQLIDKAKSLGKI